MERYNNLKNSRSPSDTRRRWIVILFCVLFVLGLSEFFAPAVMTAAWHIRHGFSLVVLGYRIPVPWQWTAEATFNNGSIMIVRSPVSYEISKRPQGLISIFPAEAKSSPIETADAEDSDLRIGSTAFKN